jgi:hypothetical protein
MSTTTSASNKENNKSTCNRSQGNKKILGGNSSLYGKTIDINSREAAHQFSDTIKAIADYVGQKHTHGGDIRYMIENLEDFNLPRPEDPPNNASQFAIKS